MSVYVDDMCRSPLGQFGRMRMSHLIADTTSELLAMVDAIGVPRKWIQHRGTAQEHFDIAMSKRDAAIRQGAIPIGMRELACMCARRGKTGSLGKPDEALGWARARAAGIAAKTSDEMEVLR